jgi:hypothetical protein
MDFQEIRKTYPQYNDMSDDDFASAFHKKFYSDLPYEDFAKKLGMKPKAVDDMKAPAYMGIPEAGLSMVAGIPSQIAGGLYGLGTLLSGQGLDKAGDAVTRIQKNNFGFGSYEGSTAPGKRAVQKASEVMAMPGEAAADYVGGPIGKALGNEELGRLSAKLPVDAALNFLPLHLGVTLPLKGAGKLISKIGPKEIAPNTSVLDTLKANKIPEAPKVPNAPEQLELPLETSSQSVAEMQSRGTGQTDLFASDTANRQVGGTPGRDYTPEWKANEQVVQQSLQDGVDAAKRQAAQNAIEARQRALEQDVARQGGLDRNAAERARQESASTGSTDWAEQQRQQANTRLPGDNTPLDLGPSRLTKASQYPDVNDFPGLLQDAPFQHDNMVDFYAGRNEQAALPITVADMLRTGDRTPDAFDRQSPKNEANRILSREPNTPENNAARATMANEANAGLGLTNEGVAPRGSKKGRQRGAVDTNAINEGIQDLIDRAKGITPGVANIQDRQKIPIGEATEITPDLVQPKPILTGIKGGKQSGVLNIKDIGDEVSKLVDKFHNIGSSKVPHQTAAEDYITQTIPGLKKDLADVITSAPKAEDIIADTMAHGKDIPKLGVITSNLQSGPTLTAAKFGNHPLVLGAGRILNHMSKTADYNIKTIVEPVYKAMSKLKPAELKDVSDIIKWEDTEGNVRSSVEELKAAGMSERGIAAYQMHRAMMDGLHEQTNAARAALGKEPITKRNAYMAASRYGDWSLSILDKSGKPAWYIRSVSKAEALAAQAYLKKNFGDKLQFDGVEPKFAKDGSKYNPDVPRDVMGAYQDMLEHFTDNPQLTSAIKEGLEKFLTEKGHGTLNHKGHFIDKTNVRGFEGDMPWLDTAENSKRLMDAQNNYAKNAMRWNAAQDAMASLKPLLNDENVIANHSNAVQYVKQVVDSQFGANKGVLTALENVLAQVMPAYSQGKIALGRSQSTLYKGVTGFKSALYLQTLGLNAAHFMATLATPFINAPAQHAVLAAEGFKANPAKIFVKTMNDFASGMIQHELHNFVNDKVELSTMSKIGSMALKYGEDNGTFVKNIYNESTSLGHNVFGDVAKAITSPTISLPEKMARMSTFFSFVHHLNDSGKFTDHMEMFRKAEEMTDNTLTSYRPADRPMIVNKAGAAGQAAYTFKSYLFNEFNQLSQFTRLAGQGNVKPLLYHLAGLAAVGGTLSVVGVNEADHLWGAFKDHIAENKPEWYHAVQGRGVKEQIIAHLPDFASYGLASTMTGMNLQSRLAPELGDPTDPLHNIIPMYQDVKELSSATKALAHLNSTTATEAVYQQMPAAVKGAMENNMDVFKGPVVDGKQTIHNPNNLMEHQAMDHRRDAADQGYRYAGATSLAEAKDTQTGYMNSQESKRIKMATDKLGVHIYDDIHTGRKDALKDDIISYLKINPNSDALNADITKRIMGSSMLPTERSIVLANTLQEIENIRRLYGTRQQR